MLSVYFHHTFISEAILKTCSSAILHCEEISLIFRDAKNHVEHEEEIIKGSVVVRSELGWMAERVMECPGLFV